MALIRPVDINDQETIAPVEENALIVENSAHIRESEVLLLRNKVSVLETQLEALTIEYKELLEDNNLIDEGVEAESLMPYPQVDVFYDPEAFDGTNYVDRKTALVPNPAYMPITKELEEGDQILGQLGRKIEWYQNEMKKKYILKMQTLKRVEDIESRENSF
jgi:hypothetical protein